MKRSDAGFTLLEVMAAVAIVGIVFTILARVASEGLKAEGTSKRRLEASLLADAELTALEEQLAVGVIPEIGVSESEEGPYALSVEVSAFDLAVALPDFKAAWSEAPEAITATSRSKDWEESPPLRSIEVVVAWSEGVNEYRVSRTTYAFDLASVRDLIPQQGLLPGGIPIPEGLEIPEELRRLLR